MSGFRQYAPDECGFDGYPPEWHTEIKHAVREAAGNRCTRCQHPYDKGAGKWSPCDELCNHDRQVRSWRILTVHHLDGNKANCRWWNLVALCQRCHLQIQGRVRMERVWPWEHSEWFRPYVAGFYAWMYLGEDLTRDQVDARLDELLALERASTLDPNENENVCS